MKKKKNKETEVSDKNRLKKETGIVGTVCNDKKCHIHGGLKTRGRIFEGKVTKKFKNRVVIELERMIYIRKYERYQRGKTKIHAHLPQCMENEVGVGDLIRIQECRPLSKMIHFAVIKKIKSAAQRQKSLGGR